jgi:hypothetical protein
MKFFERIRKGGCDLGRRFVVQPLGLDEPGASGSVPEGTSTVASGLSVVVRALPTSGVTYCNRQPSASNVVHDHIWLRQYQIRPVACVVVTIGAWDVQHAGTTESGKTMGSSCGGELSPAGSSTKMINDSRSDANRKVLITGVSKDLLPTAQVRRLWGSGLPVAAPGTGTSHIDLFCYLIPGHALVTQSHDLIGGSGMSGRTARPHGDAGTVKLLADHTPMNPKLGPDLAHGPTLGVQVSRALNVHGVTVASFSPPTDSARSDLRGSPRDAGERVRRGSDSRGAMDPSEEEMQERRVRIAKGESQ